jgi:hypothetical protein
MRAFDVRLRGAPEGRTVYAETAGKAKYETLLDLGDVFPDLEYTDLRVRCLGVMETPEERNARQIAEFNASFPPNTPVRVYPLAMGDHDSAYDTTVMEPGAFVLGGTVVVKVPGDSIALTHVVPLLPINHNRAAGN